MGIFKSIFQNNPLKEVQAREFLDELTRVNYIRARAFAKVLFILDLILFFIDYLHWHEGLWASPGYRLLFYSHLILAVGTLFMLALAWLNRSRTGEKNRWNSFYGLFFSFFILLLAAWISGFVDQLIHQQITVYIMSMLTIAVYIYLRPLVSIVMYLSSFVLFAYGIGKYQADPTILQAHIINGAIMVVVAWFLSAILYRMRLQEFINRKTIEKQKLQLEKTNAELLTTNKQLQESLAALDESQNVIFSLAVALESKDPYTRGHSERVAEYALQLAQHIGLPDEDQVLLWKAATLHDIGKIGIPDAILNKSGPLSQAEWLIMQSHPERGENICAKLNLAKDALPIIRHHRERYDGSGYPDGLKGDEIPYLARIVAMADAVDAITSDRSYRPARSMSVALQELERGSGTQFDPELVKAFKELCRKKSLVS